MKRFRVEHKNYEKPPIIVTLHQPPYENENILYKTGWKERDCKIREVAIEASELAKEVSSIDTNYIQENNNDND